MYHLLAGNPGCLAGVAACQSQIKVGWDGHASHPTGAAAYALVIGVIVVVVFLMRPGRSSS
jgi:hypothetical protein